MTEVSGCFVITWTGSKRRIGCIVDEGKPSASTYLSSFGELGDSVFFRVIDEWTRGSLCID